MAANMCIVMMHAYGEDHYRKKIADASGFQDEEDEEEVASDIMRDLGILRNSIIHHDGYVIANKRCSVLTWFKPGDKINIDLEQFSKINTRLRRS